MKRKITRPVKVGRIVIGGGFPITVQTMWKEPIKCLEKAGMEGILERIKALEAIGCELLRFSVPDVETAEILGELASHLELPLAADIHFNYKLAIHCMDYPISKIRINPGNIGAAWKVEEIIRKARDKIIPLRIGVNAGSLPKILKKEKNKVRAMLKAGEMELDILDKQNFSNVIFSLKSSSVETTVEANLLFSEKYDYPLHIGVTEAGPLIQGVVKSTLAISSLLREGVGDTIRISLSDSPENEIIAGCSLLQNTKLRTKGVDIISCPTCGRAVFDVKAFLDNVQNYIQSLNKDISIAVMGCPVNGPGEAKHADLGITGAGGYVVLFKRGKVLRRERMNRALDAFKEEVDKL